MTDEQSQPDKTFTRCIIKEAKGAYIGLVTWIIVFVAATAIVKATITFLNFVMEYSVNYGAGIRDAADAFLNGIGTAILSVIPLWVIFVLLLMSIPAVYALIKCLCRWYRGFAAPAIVTSIVGGLLIILLGGIAMNVWLFFIGGGLLVLAICTATIEDKVRLERERNG